MGLILANNNEFIDFDFKSYYKPASEKFFGVYFMPSKDYLLLSAQVPPLFPFFLSLIGENTNAVIFIFILSNLVLVLTYKVCLKLASKKVALIAVFILSLEPSFFIASINLGPEIFLMLNLVIGAWLLICKNELKYSKQLAFALFGLCVLIRPIALPFVIVLTVYYFVKYFYSRNFTFLIYAFLLVLPSTIWTIRNLFVHKIASVSLITSNNLFLYEGVPAASESLGRPWEFIADQEVYLRESIIGKQPSTEILDTYNTQRGIELIFSYPIGWLFSHMKGLLKLLFGINKTKYEIIYDQLFSTNISILLIISNVVFGLFIATVWVSFIKGFLVLKLTQPRITCLLLVLISMILIPASGHIAYARFRSPITPFICIFSAIGVAQLYPLLKDARYNYKKGYFRR